MSSKLETGAEGKQSARDLDVEQSQSPVPSSISETANRQHVATDKPFSVFTYKEKWLIVSFASCAALFR